MNSPQWVDNHCHLDPVTATETIAAAAAAGVRTLVTVGCDLESSKQCLDMARAHEGVFATAGVHPHEAKHGTSGIEPLLDEDHIVAVGEAGLDYYYDHSARDVQRQVFADQIAMANERDLPLVIHSRDAWADTFEVLDAEGVPERTVFHCFTGGPAEASECLDRGALLSISGIVTFNSAGDVQAAVERVPLDRLLVETDSPYLAPVPHRGRTNQPAHVVLVGEAIANLKKCAVAAVAEQTTATAKDFYNL